MRADKFLTENGYYESRARAQAAIKVGRVKVNGRVLKKASEILSETDDILATLEHPYVSRGALKLVHALKAFQVNPEGKVCLDVGSSTGGFTEVLIAKGASKVFAVDVGQDQLHDRLKGRADIVSLEQTDARDLTVAHITHAPKLIVTDASFISLTKVLETPLSLAAPHAELIALIKPQFEVGKSGLGRGGIVKSESLALQAVSDVCAWVSGQGWHVKATTRSPIKGGSGNTEYLLHAMRLS